MPFWYVFVRLLGYLLEFQTIFCWWPLRGRKLYVASASWSTTCCLVNFRRLPLYVPDLCICCMCCVCFAVKTSRARISHASRPLKWPFKPRWNGIVLSTVTSQNYVRWKHFVVGKRHVDPYGWSGCRRMIVWNRDGESNVMLAGDVSICTATKWNSIQLHYQVEHYGQPTWHPLIRDHSRWNK